MSKASKPDFNPTANRDTPWLNHFSWEQPPWSQSRGHFGIKVTILLILQQNLKYASEEVVVTPAVCVSEIKGNFSVFAVK